MDYKLTVIMSNYNQASLIGGAIDSVLAQKTNFPFQLIITDDNSVKDDSVNVLKQYEKKYPDVIKVLYNKENGRYLKNILRAKSITKTPYFTLLDADDYWTDENYLQDAIDYLDANPDKVIYARNVQCVDENGKTWLFIPENIPNRDYTMVDYLKNDIVIPQTTGGVFRNVIFAKGIPDIMTNAIGTIHERSFEGDFDRFIMHLKYGGSHFENKVSGVYRVLSSGIWSRMNDFERNAIQAQTLIDYNEYFEHKHIEFFIKSAWKNIQTAIEYIKTPHENATFSTESQNAFFNALTECMRHADLLTTEKPQLKKLKDKIRLKIYKKLHKKLAGKGLI